MDHSAGGANRVLFGTVELGSALDDCFDGAAVVSEVVLLVDVWGLYPVTTALHLSKVPECRSNIANYDGINIIYCDLIKSYK